MHDVQLLRLRAVTAQHFFVEIIRQLCLVAGKLDEHPFSVIDGNSNAIDRGSRLAYMENRWRQEILMNARQVEFMHNERERMYKEAIENDKIKLYKR